MLQAGDLVAPWIASVPPTESDRRPPRVRAWWSVLIVAVAWGRGGEALGQPSTAAAAPSGVPFWQVPAVPQAVVQGGAIPPGWQPQAVPYHGIGPDGKPVTMYVAPTYVFTYQSGPPVLGAAAATRGVNRGVPAPAATASGWNYATSGARPASPAVPATTVTRYPPTAYQFPDNARALTGTPVMPPAGSPEPPPPQAWAAATPPTPAAAPAPPVVAPAPPPPAPSSGDWVTVVPPAVAAATLAGTALGSQGSAVVEVPPMAPFAGAVSAQPVSSGGLSAPPSAIAAPHLWRVVGVQDGDTLTCLDETNQQQRVRLSGIDAPEIGQDYGTESREALASLVFGKTVEVLDEGRDASGRWIARLAVNGVDVSRQMVATGSAWNYPSSSADQSLAAAQGQAQAQRAGLWAAASPTPPWAYRQAAGGS